MAGETTRLRFTEDVVLPTAELPNDNALEMVAGRFHNYGHGPAFVPDVIDDEDLLEVTSRSPHYTVHIHTGKGCDFCIQSGYDELD